MNSLPTGFSPEPVNPGTSTQQVFQRSVHQVEEDPQVCSSIPPPCTQQGANGPTWGQQLPRSEPVAEHTSCWPPALPAALEIHICKPRLVLLPTQTPNPLAPPCPAVLPLSPHWELPSWVRLDSSPAALLLPCHQVLQVILRIFPKVY